MSDKAAVFVFNKNRYDLNKLLLLGKAGPSVTINIKEINMFEGNVEVSSDKINPEHVITFEDAPEKIDYNGVIFFKQHGKYTIFFGKELVIAAGLSGIEDAVAREKVIQERIANGGDEKKVRASFGDNKPVLVKGRLISTPALKTVRINPEVAHAAVPDPIHSRPSYPDGFQNRPRFSERSKPFSQNTRTYNKP